MRKIDYEILAAAIAKHSNEPDDYENDQQTIGARKACEKIARTFVRFAGVKKPDFLHACGIK